MGLLGRTTIIGLMAAVVLLPLSIVAYQSFLSAPFFMPNAALSASSYSYVFNDPDFWVAMRNSLFVATVMVMVALPAGATLAYLIVRTDLPGKATFETLLLVPMLIPSIVLGFGYIVAVGPVGFFSLYAREWFGVIPWNIYAPASIAVLAGLSVVPYVYIYISTALRNIGSDVDEAARITGASPLRVALSVSLPMSVPSIAFTTALIFLIGLELFGLPLILGTPNGFDVMAVYLFKLTNRMGMPAYQLMAVVVLVLVSMTIPLAFLQRYFLRRSERFVSVKGKGNRMRPVPLGRWKWVAFGAIVLWIAVTTLVPLTGIVIRSFVSRWGVGVDLLDAFTLDTVAGVLRDPVMLRGIRNSVLIGVVGGAFAVLCYLMIALSVHRRNDIWTKIVDYLALVPRGMPSLVAGLAFLWVFLFFPPLKPLRPTLFSVWLAYSVVWLAYGMRLISGALMQVSKDLEEAARVSGAGPTRTTWVVTVPLIRNGLLASWLLIFLMFEREYATGVYLLTSGTEVIGTLLVTLAETGAMDRAAALSLVNVVIIGLGLGLALRLGVRVNE